MDKPSRSASASLFRGAEDLCAQKTSLSAQIIRDSSETTSRTASRPLLPEIPALFSRDQSFRQSNFACALFLSSFPNDCSNFLQCDPLMLDSRVNNSFTVALNLFQCLLFAAIRFRRHVEFLDSAAPNVRFFKGVVFAAIAAARRRVSELRIKHHRQGFVCKLRKPEQLWLGLRAFHLALRIKRKISPFRQLCPFLLRLLKRPEYSPIALRFSVVTTDPSTVAMLKGIR